MPSLFLNHLQLENTFTRPRIRQVGLGAKVLPGKVAARRRRLNAGRSALRHRQRETHHREGRSIALAIKLEHARLGPRPIESFSMLDVRNPMLWFMGVLAATLVLLLARNHFSAEARSRRRREKSQRRVMSRRQGPTVRLETKVNKPKNNRKR